MTAPAFPRAWLLALALPLAGLALGCDDDTAFAPSGGGDGGAADGGAGDGPAAPDAGGIDAPERADASPGAADAAPADDASAEGGAPDGASGDGASGDGAADGGLPVDAATPVDAIGAPCSQGCILAERAQIPGRTPQGDTWDPLGNGPDPYVTVRLADGRVGMSRTITDALRPAWNQIILAGTGPAALAMPVVVTLLDEDVGGDDRIATWTTTITPQQVASGQLTLTAGQGSSQVTLVLGLR